MSDREKAKQIIAEIVRCSGGRVESKTRLFKLFYLAHLIYAKREPDYLSNWPIVRMPHGPGIDRGEDLIGELCQAGVLEAHPVPVGPYMSTEYRLADDEMPGLPLEAIEAIRDAVKFAGDKSASELSELTHQHSHSWKNSVNGEELNIYVDLLGEEEYSKRIERLDIGVHDLREIGEL
jgi:hypothetical protein